MYFSEKFKNYENITKRKEELNKKKDKKDYFYYQFTYQLQKYIFRKNNEIKYESLNLNNISKLITQFNYFLSLIGNKKKKRVFYVLDKFREKILGEEKLFRTKIYLYHLERYFNMKEVEKIDILELYND